MLIITGMPGSGKDEFVRVAKKFGFLDVHMGNTVKRYANDNNIELTDRTIGAFATEERDNYGMDIWAKRTSVYIKDPDITMVDGLRNYEELLYFKNYYKNVFVIAVFANADDRLDRIIKRNREDDFHDHTGFENRDSRELSWGIGKVISLADYMIVNDSTLGEYKKNVELLLNEVIKRHNIKLKPEN